MYIRQATSEFTRNEGSYMKNAVKRARKTGKAGKIQKVYQVSKEYLNGLDTEMTDELEYTVPCPSCTGRAFDFSGLPQGLLRVRLKCPHCRKIVEIPIDSNIITINST